MSCETRLNDARPTRPVSSKILGFRQLHALVRRLRALPCAVLTTMKWHTIDYIQRLTSHERQHVLGDAEDAVKMAFIGHVSHTLGLSERLVVARIRMGTLLVRDRANEFSDGQIRA